MMVLGSDSDSAVPEADRLEQLTPVDPQPADDPEDPVGSAEPADVAEVSDSDRAEQVAAAGEDEYPYEPA